MPLYVKGYNQTLGDTSDNYGTSAAQIYENRQGAVSDGFYWIQASGMSNPKQLWCDFSCGGGTIGNGFQRFWWCATHLQEHHHVDGRVGVGEVRA